MTQVPQHDTAKATHERRQVGSHLGGEPSPAAHHRLGDFLVVRGEEGGDGEVEGRLARSLVLVLVEQGKVRSHHRRVLRPACGATSVVSGLV